MHKSGLLCHSVRSHIRRVHECLAVNLLPALWAEWQESFTCWCGNTWVGRMQYWNKGQHRKLTGEENSYATPARDWTSNLPVTWVHHSTTELYPQPKGWARSDKCQVRTPWPPCLLVKWVNLCLWPKFDGQVAIGQSACINCWVTTVL